MTDAVISALLAYTTGTDEFIPLSNSVVTEHGIRFSQFQWHRSMRNGVPYLTLVLSLHNTPFGQLHGVLSHSNNCNEEEPSDETLLRSLLARANDLRVCPDCTAIHPSTSIKDGRCCSCHLARALNSRSETCSICREDAERYYTTSCGHSFHHSCIATHARTALHQHVTHRPADDLPKITCPNCRGDLLADFAAYMTACEV